MIDQNFDAEETDNKDKKSFLFSRNASPAICKKCKSLMKCVLKQDIVIWKCKCGNSFEEDFTRDRVKDDTKDKQKPKINIKINFSRALSRHGIGYWRLTQEDYIDNLVPGFWHRVADLFTHE